MKNIIKYKTNRCSIQEPDKVLDDFPIDYDIPSEHI